MPEFILDHGSIEGARSFKSLDSFTQGYVEAMFFTSASSADDGDLNGATFAELAPDTLTCIISDCNAFQVANGADLDEATDTGCINGYDIEAAGRDFWYSRNGHGIGYFDRDLGDIGDKLQDIARNWREVNLYRGDDGLIYLM